MSEYTTNRSSRGSSTRNPSSYGSADDVVTYPKIPRTYTTGGGSLSVSKGFYIYPKPGELVFFFSDSNGTKKIQKSKNQVNDPVRVGGELVGTATGKTATGSSGTFIEVDWVNSYVNHNLFKADEKVNELKVGWVNSSKVDWQNVYISPDEQQSGNTADPDVANPPINQATGNTIEPTTLGFVAVAAAIIFSKKKRKK